MENPHIEKLHKIEFTLKKYIDHENRAVMLFRIVISDGRVVSAHYMDG